MKRYTKIALLAVSILLVLGMAMASEYAYGSKVQAGDSDVGLPLHLFGPTAPGTAFQIPAHIAFWDIGTVPGAYDSEDVVYLHFGPPFGLLPVAPFVNPLTPVRVSDIRLTPFGNNPAGSKVTANDNDVGMPLNQFPPGNLQWLNLYGSAAFDLGDPVILHAGIPGSPTVLNDVRLTQSEGMPAGSKIQNSDPDFGKITQIPAINAGNPLVPLINPNILYFDVNGNSQYDYPDDVYLRFPIVGTVPPFTVKVNDVRLSGPIWIGS
jgi:hypothetical protein